MIKDAEGMDNALDYYSNVDSAEEIEEEWNNHYCLTFDYDDWDDTDWRDDYDDYGTYDDDDYYDYDDDDEFEDFDYDNEDWGDDYDDE